MPETRHVVSGKDWLGQNYVEDDRGNKGTGSTPADAEAGYKAATSSSSGSDSSGK